MRQRHIYVKTTYKALTRRPWSLTLGFLACLGLGGLRRQRHNPGRICHSFFRRGANLDVTGSIITVAAAILLLLCGITTSI